MASRALMPIVFLVLASSHALAFDPSPLQDFCVAERDSQVTVNGFPCKKRMDVSIDDFVFSGLDKPRSTDNQLGSNVTQVNVNMIPGLNTLGIALARVDYAPYGLNAPHTHPRATEVLTLLEGTLYAGFVSGFPEPRLYAKVLKPGDVIVFPFGQIHFQMNIGDKPAVALSGLSSQFPGVIPIASTVFGANPAISDDVLSRAFQIDKKLVDRLQAQSWTGGSY